MLSRYWNINGFALVINLSSDNYISILNKYVCYYNVHEDSISRSIESIKIINLSLIGLLKTQK